MTGALDFAADRAYYSIWPPPLAGKRFRIFAMKRSTTDTATTATMMVVVAVVRPIMGDTTPC